MDIFGPVTFPEILMAWALHEYQGRYQPELPPELRKLPADQARQLAIRALVFKRQGAILPMLASGIRECLHVRLTPGDIARLFVMGADPVANWSKNKLAEKDVDGSADYVRRLAAGAEPVSGPFVAIGRSAEGTMTLFDGMHRAAAWVAHVNEGRGYPLEQVHLVLTEWPSPAHELPPA